MIRYLPPLQPAVALMSSSSSKRPRVEGEQGAGVKAKQMVVEISNYVPPAEADSDDAIWDGTRSFLFFTIDLAAQPVNNAI